MNRRYSAVALSALALGTVALTVTEASAIVRDPGLDHTSAGVQAKADDWPDERLGFPADEPKSSEYSYPDYKYDAPAEPESTIQRIEVPVDDNGVETLQAGASALGGAAVAFGAMWLYRRRQAPAG